MKKLIVLLLVLTLLVGCKGMSITFNDTRVNEAIKAVSTQTIWCIGIPEVKVDGYIPGMTIQGTVVVHNGDDGKGTFTIHSDNSYMGVKDAKFSLSPMQTKAAVVTLHIPEKTEMPQLLEIRITIDKEQSGFVKTSYQQKWLITPQS